MKLDSSTFYHTIFVIAAFILSVTLLFSENYKATYWCLMIFLISAANIKRGITIQLLSYFLLGYLGIALLDISHYRGVISIETLKMYSFTVLVILTGLIVIDLLLIILTKHSTRRYSRLDSLNKIQKLIINVHLIIVYLFLAYLYYSIGVIVINQELRFQILTAIGYVVKSSIYIPLVYWNSSDTRNVKNIIIYTILPLLPATLIGSRGTVVMILFGIFLIYILQNKTLLYVKNKQIDFKKKYLFIGTILVMIFIYIPYYIRRLSQGSSYLTPSEALNEYFYSEFFIGYLIMPLHLGFKETIMLSNNIIVQNIENVYTNLPLFIVDLMTILPGYQVGAGQVMAKLFGTVAGGGLTPGILGGLYIDFQNYSFFIIFLLTLFLYTLERLLILGDKLLVIYALSFIQFLHLFHRGFLKPEYIFSYVIVFFYLFFSTTHKGRKI